MLAFGNLQLIPGYGCGRINVTTTIINNIAVCVCTRNRPDELYKCLSSISGCGELVKEIVVSDDSTNDKTKEMVIRNFPSIAYVKGPCKGLGANRNVAFSASSAPFVIFLDDDALISKNFILEMENFCQSNKVDLSSTIISGGQIEYGKLVNPHKQDYFGFQSVEYEAGEEYETINIMATVFPRSILLKTRFDELLIYGYDEVDICARAREIGAVIAYCPSAIIEHFPSPVNREYYKPFKEASRIYVTYKKHRIINKNTAYAWTYLLIAMSHLLASRIKNSGFYGVAEFFKTGNIALAYIRSC